MQEYTLTHMYRCIHIHTCVEALMTMMMSGAFITLIDASRSADPFLLMFVTTYSPCEHFILLLSSWFWQVSCESAMRDGMHMTWGNSNQATNQVHLPRMCVPHACLYRHPSLPSVGTQLKARRPAEARTARISVVCKKLSLVFAPMLSGNWRHVFTWLNWAACIAWTDVMLFPLPVLL